MPKIPHNNFFPSPGTILSRRTPSGPGIRLDDGVYEGFTVPTEYDPLLGKLIAWGRDRAEAIARLERALAEYTVTGIKTNTSLFRRILKDPEFIRGEIFTRWLDERLPHFSPQGKSGRRSRRRRRSHSRRRCFTISLWPRAASQAMGPPGKRNRAWKREARLEQVDRNR